MTGTESGVRAVRIGPSTQQLVTAAVFGLVVAVGVGAGVRAVTGSSVVAVVVAAVVVLGVATVVLTSFCTRIDQDGVHRRSAWRLETLPWEHVVGARIGRFGPEYDGVPSTTLVVGARLASRFDDVEILSVGVLRALPQARSPWARRTRVMLQQAATALAQHEVRIATDDLEDRSALWAMGIEGVEP